MAAKLIRNIGAALFGIGAIIGSGGGGSSTPRTVYDDLTAIIDVGGTADPERGFYSSIWDALEDGKTNLLIDRRGGVVYLNQLPSGGGMWDLAAVTITTFNPGPSAAIVIVQNDAATGASLISSLPAIVGCDFRVQANATVPAPVAVLDGGGTHATSILDGGNVSVLSSNTDPIKVQGNSALHLNINGANSSMGNFVTFCEVDAGSFARIFARAPMLTIYESGFKGTGTLEIYAYQPVIIRAFSGDIVDHIDAVANPTNIATIDYKAVYDHSRAMGYEPVERDMIGAVDDPGDTFDSVRDSSVGRALDWLIRTIGVRNKLYVDGSKPTKGYRFQTIAEAVAVANTLSDPMNAMRIEIAGGVYIEPPITLGDDIQLFGDNRVIVAASDANSPLFTVGDRNFMREITFNGPANSSCIEVGDAQDFLGIDCRFVGGSIGVHATHANATATVLNSDATASVGTAVYAQLGYILANFFLTSSTVGFRTDAGATLRVTNAMGQGCTTGLLVDGAGTVRSESLILTSCTRAIETQGAGGADISCVNPQISGSGTHDVLQNAADDVILLRGGFYNLDLLELENAVNFTFDAFNNSVGDRAFQMGGDANFGTLEAPREVVFVEGNSYILGVEIRTTDGTASAAVDGGNLTDVSASNRANDGSTYTFQGATAGHAILFGTTRKRLGTLAKHWGMKIKLASAAVEDPANPLPFAFEIWDGAAWVEINTMSTHADLYHYYGNKPLTRAQGHEEQINYGVTDNTTWATKTIDGVEAYWSRIRLKEDVTTLPDFDRAKLHSSRIEFNKLKGVEQRFGEARRYKTIAIFGNVWSDSGVGNTSITIGTPSYPHQFGNGHINSNGDYVTMQFKIPDGVDTSLPLRLEANVITRNAGATDIQLDCQVTEITPAGVLVAPAGDQEAPEAATGETLAGAPSQVNAAAPVDNNTVGRETLADFGEFDISDRYPGSSIYFKITRNAGTGSIIISSANVLVPEYKQDRSVS